MPSKSSQRRTTSPPIYIYQLVDFIGAYSIVLDVILGIDHQYWDHQKSTVVNALVVESHGFAILHTLRYIQISCLGYFNEKM